MLLCELLKENKKTEGGRSGHGGEMLHNSAILLKSCSSSNASEQMKSLGEKGYIVDQEQQRALSLLRVSRAHTLRALGAYEAAAAVLLAPSYLISI